MDIKHATEQIEGAIKAYLSKNEHGLYRIPFHMQRPIIMFGPPGVGKTAIVAQIAEKLDINFVSYSITHHTRQSALGLPFISSKVYGNKEYNVSEYTMSEIIGSVYDSVAESGVQEGILFLDEVNCVSETLAPAMLQFLQYKTFGMHQLPEGWIIVTAGNPPEYNRSAREFDPVTLDRLKRIDIEPDVEVWKEYATAHGVHPAITTYLEAKPNHFYKVQASTRGSKMVTARGWEDLSRMINAYEAENIPVDIELVRQYLQDNEIADDFEVYYQLFRKYKEKYRADEILAGKIDDGIIAQAKQAAFDERIALVGLLLDALFIRVHASIELEEALRAVRSDILGFRSSLNGDDPAKIISNVINAVKSSSGVGKKQKDAVADKDIVKAERLRILGLLVDALQKAKIESDNREPYVIVKEAFNAECKRQSGLVEKVTLGINSSFEFFDKAYGAEGQESLIFVTKLSADPIVIKHVAEHGSEKFMQHNKSLLFHERGLNLLKEIEDSLGDEPEMSDAE